MSRLLVVLGIHLGLLVACDGAGDGAGSADAAAAAVIDAAGPIDGSVLPLPDATPPDAAGGLPLPGFATLTGACDNLMEAQLTGPTPGLHALTLDFGTDRYDDPAERPLLTDGGEEIILDGNAGGSSLYSEVFAFEVLARCELSTLLKTETEIVYDTNSKKTDFLAEIDGHKIGVSVTRAVTFPFGQPYTVAAATQLLSKKLGDILLASASVSAGDRWSKQLLAVLAYDAQHAQVVDQVWQGLDAELRADTILIVITTAGDDLFIYTDE